MQLEKIISEVSTTCQEVGKFLINESRSFSKEKVEFKKSQSDLVSYVDKTAEQRLVESLSRIIPGCGYLTEESMVEQKREEFTWVIDPLDGTTNFVHGIPTFAISIGLLHDDEIVGGVILEVNRNECFSAWKGGGAYLNGSRIRVSEASNIEESLFSTGFPSYNFEKMDDYLGILNRLMKGSHGLRRIGSAATDLAYVAMGRFEGFFEYNLNPWDVAAGVILVQEAGGTVTDFKGGENYMFGREIVAAGPVHSNLLKVVQHYWLG